MKTEEFEVFGAHAVAIHVAAELLAEASEKATKEHWLSLILAKAFTRYEETTPEELQEMMSSTVLILGQTFADVLDPMNIYQDEGSRLPDMNQDDPNRPGVGDQF